MALQTADHLEGLLEGLFFEFGKIRRVDVVVRGLLLLNHAQLVDKAHLHEEFIGLHGFAVQLMGKMAVFVENLEAAQGIVFGDSVFQGEEPGEIDKRDQPFFLEIKGVFVLPVLFHDEVAEKRKRRSRLQGVLGQVEEENLLLGDVAHQILPEAFRHGRVAICGPEVKEDGGVHDLKRLGLVQPLIKVPAPAGDRLPPFWVGGHDLPRAEWIAATDQMVDRLFPQSLKICRGQFPLRLAFRLGVEQGVVLIGDEGLFPAALAAHDQPAKGQRRGAEFFNKQGEQPVKDVVVEHRDHPGDVVGLGAFLDEGADNGRDFPGQGVKPLDSPLCHDFPEEIEGRGALEEHDVVGGDYPDDGPLLLHGQMVDGKMHHLQHGIETHLMGGDGLQGRRHDLAYRGLVVEPGRDHLGPQIPVGDDADDFSLLVVDQQGTDMQLRHPGRRHLNAVRRGNGFRGALDDTADLGREKEEGAFGARGNFMLPQLGIGGFYEFFGHAAQKVMGDLGG